MVLNQRVRAIIINESNKLLLIKRVRAGMEPYWVTPGGGVEQSDENLEAAIRREAIEELGAEIDIHKLVYVLDQETTDGRMRRESFFLCTARSYNFERRTGPEFADPSKGDYRLDEVAFTPQILLATNIRPDELRLFLVNNCFCLRSLPDLRAEAPRGRES